MKSFIKYATIQEFENDKQNLDDDNTYGILITSTGYSFIWPNDYKEKEDEKPEDKPENKPEDKGDEKPEDKGDEKPEDKGDEKPEDKGEQKTIIINSDSNIFSCQKLDNNRCIKPNYMKLCDFKCYKCSNSLCSNCSFKYNCSYYTSNKYGYRLYNAPNYIVRKHSSSPHAALKAIDEQIKKEESKAARTYVQQNIDRFFKEGRLR